MRSDMMKKGVERAPHRSLFKASGFTDEELSRPLIGVACSTTDVIPGHVHLDRILEAVQIGIRMAGGTPIKFHTIGVDDGIAMGHLGMKYSLSSREVIADSVEIMSVAHPFDSTRYSFQESRLAAAATAGGFSDGAERFDRLDVEAAAEVVVGEVDADTSGLFQKSLLHHDLEALVFVLFVFVSWFVQNQTQRGTPSARGHDHP